MFMLLLIKWLQETASLLSTRTLLNVMCLTTSTSEIYLSNHMEPTLFKTSLIYTLPYVSSHSWSWTDIGASTTTTEKVDLRVRKVKVLLCVNGFLLQWVQLSLKLTLRLEQKGLGSLVKHEARIRFSGPPARVGQNTTLQILKKNVDLGFHIRNLFIKSCDSATELNSRLK